MHPLVRATDDLAGREAELARLLPLLDDVEAANGRVVLVSGEPGIGKTALVRAILGKAADRGARGFLGRCFEQHTTAPYFPFTELLLSILNRATAEYRKNLLLRFPELASVVPGLQDEKRSSMDTEGAQLRLFRSVAEVLHEQAELSPLMIVIEDLHWADASSLDLFLFIGRHLASTRILLIATFREAEIPSRHELEVMLRELVRERLAEDVHLAPLDHTATADLIARRLGVSSTPEHLLSVVEERAHGNPFFVEEWLKALLARGWLRIDGNTVSFTPTDAIEVPASLRSVVREQVGRLPRNSQDLLRLASLLGVEFGLDSLIAASGEPEEAILDAMDPVVEAQLLHVASGSQDRYTFAHALVQQALYEDIPAHRRRSMHLRLGESLAELPRAVVTSAALARYFQLGGDAGRAARFAREAGDDSANRYAHFEAIHHYVMALDLLDREQAGAARADVQCRLASELYDTGRVAESLEMYRSAVAASSGSRMHTGRLERTGALLGFTRVAMT